jgi:hypothetical protein
LIEVHRAAFLKEMCQIVCCPGRVETLQRPAVQVVLQWIGADLVFFAEDFALTLNIGLGLLVEGDDAPQRMQRHIESLIEQRSDEARASESR